MTYDEALEHLTSMFGLPELTARNMLLVAFKGQNAWFGGPTGPYRMVYSQESNGFRVLADGYAPMVAS
jgi:hypothetical protein